MPEGQQPREVTPSPRSEAVAENARLRRRRNGREELPCVQGQGQQPGGATPHLRSGAMAKRSHPTFKARGTGREEPSHAQERPHFRGSVTTWAQEGLEELSHVEGQEGRW